MAIGVRAAGLAYDQPTVDQDPGSSTQVRAQMMETIQTMRRATLEVVESVPRTAWKRDGLHPERARRPSAHWNWSRATTSIT
jgi:hypothetical protein